MQNRSFPFWLMIVSSSTVVLPVKRSPMISSRWPRPIGIMVSIALMPVCIGLSTRLRVITPGTIRSSGSVLVVLIGPLSSSGTPSGLTMRPMSAETRLASKSFKRSLMTSEISRVLMLNLSLLRGRQPAAQLLQSSGDAGVDDPVAVLQFHPAEDPRIDDEAQAYVLVQTF